MQGITKIITTLAVFGTIGACVVTPSDQSEQAYTVVIENVTVIDAVAGQRGPVTVMLRDDKIAELSSTRLHEAWPADVEVIDGTDKYLIPGLWDMHVHLTFLPDFGSEMLSLFLANGITSVRDTGGALDGVLAIRAEARSKKEDAPRVFVAGPLLDGIPVVYDGSADGFPALGVGISNPAAGRAKVAELAEAGVDLIKAYEMLTPETFKAILNEARKRGLPVTGHVPLSMSATDALDAGLASVEHLRNIDLACASNHKELLEGRRTLLADASDTPGRTLRQSIHAAQRDRSIADYDADVCQRVIDSIVTNKTAQIPTLTLLHSVYRRIYETPEWQRTFDDLPSSMRETWLSDASRWSSGADRSAPVEAVRTAYMDWFTATIEAIHSNGGTILAGTDTPIFFMTPGASLHKELEVLVRAGLRPIDALAAATTGPASYFGLESEIGDIRRGATADLVLLDANPLNDIRNTREISAVVRDGVVHNRAALDDLLLSVREKK